MLKITAAIFAATIFTSTAEAVAVYNQDLSKSGQESLEK